MGGFNTEPDALRLLHPGSSYLRIIKKCNYFVAPCIFPAFFCVSVRGGTAKNTAKAIFSSKLAGTLTHVRPKQIRYEIGPTAYCFEIASAESCVAESNSPLLTT